MNFESYLEELERFFSKYVKNSALKCGACDGVFDIKN